MTRITDALGKVTTFTHNSGNTVTMSSGRVRLNWADLAGTGTSFPGWQLASTNGPYWNPSPGTWTNNLNVWSTATFKLVLQGITWQTVISGITYTNNGSSGRCIYN